MTIKEIKAEGVPAETLTVNGWEYRRISDSLTEALADVFDQYTDELSEYLAGDVNQTYLVRSLLKIDEKLLDGEVAEQIKANIEKASDYEQSKAWSLREAKGGV